MAEEGGGGSRRRGIMAAAGGILWQEKTAKQATWPWQQKEGVTAADEGCPAAEVGRGAQSWEIV